MARRTGRRDAKADFSFLLARGPRSHLGFLRSTASGSASGDSQLLLFRPKSCLRAVRVALRPEARGELL